MGTAKGNVIQQSDIIHLEHEMNNLWGELNTSNIPHSVRKELEEKLSGCEDQFKSVLEGQASFQDLEKKLKICDHTLAMAAIQQAENELPKASHTAGCFQSLENIRKELNAGTISPIKARHEVKDIMRHHI